MSFLTETHLCGVHICKYCHGRTVHNVKAKDGKNYIDLHKCMDCDKKMVYQCTTKYTEKR